MEKENKDGFTSLENFKESDKIDNCEGNGCDFISWEVFYHSGTTVIREIKLTNTGSKRIRINAAWGNALGGCGVGPFDFTIDPGRNTILRFSQDHLILGYCRFKANIIQAVKSEIDSLDDEIKVFVQSVKNGSLEPVIVSESTQGNSVWFWKDGNNCYLKLVNNSGSDQRTDYAIHLKKDNRWRVHAHGYFILQPNTEHLQGFHAWDAEDWNPQWQ